MKHITANIAVKDFPNVLDNVITQGDIISIATDSGAAILVNQDEWNSMLETLHLQSIPNLTESIMEGKATPISESTILLENQKPKAVMRVSNLLLDFSWHPYLSGYRDS